MRKIVFYSLIIFSIGIVCFYGLLILDYLVTFKYHVEEFYEEDLIYTSEERGNEINYLITVFSVTIAYAITMIFGLAYFYSTKKV